MKSCPRSMGRLGGVVGARNVDNKGMGIYSGVVFASLSTTDSYQQTSVSNDAPLGRMP